MAVAPSSPGVLVAVAPSSPVFLARQGRLLPGPDKNELNLA